MFTVEQVIDANQRLLDSIASCDYETYEILCADDLTCFEPESNGMLVQGLEFHKYYFDLSGKMPLPIFRTNITMSNPHVRFCGKHCAVISYTRVDQTLNAEQKPITKTVSETRIWEVRDDALVHVHFHKSPKMA